MHIGNARIAIVNFLFCQKNSGNFLLRIDDTDITRSSKESEDAILRDLKWLGIKHDKFFRQSERLDRYRDVMRRLINDGYLYKCYETQEELEFKRKKQASSGQSYVYDRSCLKLTVDEQNGLEKRGIKPYWRFKLPHVTITWSDMILGEISYNLANVSDPVVVKADGTFLYTFASVIDDCDSDITHIIRGQDHTTNTAVQIAMLNIIASKPTNIKFGHMSLLISADGSQFSKRIGSVGLNELRKSGIEPMAIMDMVATLGSNLNPVLFTKLEDLVQYFDITRFSTNSPKFDVNELKKLNKKVVRNYTYDEITTLGINIKRDIFELVRQNVENVGEYTKWMWIFSENFNCEYKFNKEEKQALHDVIDDLDNVKYKTGRENRYILEPLRIALTGLKFGPNIAKIIEILGNKESLKRIQTAISG